MSGFAIQNQTLSTDCNATLAGMIGKTRHSDENHLSEAHLAFGQGCGVLQHSPPPGPYRHTRYAPSDKLSDWVEHFWLEAWQFPDSTVHTREVLPHPSVHLVFAPGRSRIYGIQSERFVRELKGQDSIFGIKFRPGAFYPFFRRPVHSIANRSILATQVFSDATDVEKEVLACGNAHGMVDMAERFLLENLPPSDPNAESARRAVEQIVRDRDLTRVQHLVERLGVPERTLQRLFWRYVGINPRWVIKRYRMYEALEQLTEGRPSIIATMAQNLGYFDEGGWPPSPASRL